MTRLQFSRGAAAQWTLCVVVAALLVVACGAQPAGSAAPQPATTVQPPSAPTVRPQSTPAQPAVQPTAQAAPTAAQAATTAAPSPTGQVLGMNAVPPCTPGAALTPAQTEGPYYKANPPQRSSLVEEGMAGTRLTITGFVVFADCKPISGARVDFWQANDQGQYDNSGYTLRGYTLTEANGRFTMETIVPGLYPGRTRHIHVKVGAPGGPTLTSQLYFPNEPANSRDSIFDARLVMDVQDAGTGKAATYNFVIPAA